MRYDKRIMDAVLNINKPQGMTPLQVLDAIRIRYPKYRTEKMTYAGRLDPMAEGVLIVLIGTAVYRKEEYLSLDKVYEADIIFGLSTDTHDLLGMVERWSTPDIVSEKLETEVKHMKGTFEYTLPIYSSKPVQGKPLFQWAREGKLDEIKIPKRMMHIHDVELLDQYMSTVEELERISRTCIKSVRGDFRQEEILDRWRTVLGDMDEMSKFPAVRIRVHCASGTYIRALAHELGKRLGTDAVVSRLIRTQVGRYTQEASQKIG